MMMMHERHFRDPLGRRFVSTPADEPVPVLVLVLVLVFVLLPLGADLRRMGLVVAATGNLTGAGPGIVVRIVFRNRVARLPCHVAMRRWNPCSIRRLCRARQLRSWGWGVW